MLNIYYIVTHSLGLLYMLYQAVDAGIDLQMCNEQHQKHDASKIT